jgi:CRISPR/Cas system CSM-associated protein Csm3 (group 7 of RAMP superfamily)
MRCLRLKVSILEYWHAGTGRSAGPVFDLEVVRTPGGLPYLPGRTLRGLLREGVQQAEESGLRSVPSGATQRLFGKPPDGLRSGGDGILRVSDATLGPELETWAGAQCETVTSSLFAPLAGTAIDRGTSQVKEGSLRVVEVAVPVTLQATLHVTADGVDVATPLRAGLGFLRGLGSHRRRGLGRARFELEEA